MKAVALRRARYYFVEIAAMDITRRRRVTLAGYGIAVSTLALGCVLLSPAFITERGNAWVPLGPAGAFYVAGFVLLFRIPSLVEAVRAAVANEIYMTSEYVDEMRALRYLRPDSPQDPGGRAPC